MTPRRAPLRLQAILLLLALQITSPVRGSDAPAGNLPEDLLRREAVIRELYLHAEREWSGGDANEALARIRSILSRDPEHPLASLGLVLRQERAGSLDKTEAQLAAYLARDGPARSYGLGVLRFFQGRLSDAEDLFRKALREYEARAHPSGEAAAWTGLGNVLMYTSRYREALNSYALARSLAERLGDEKSVAEILGNVAGVRREMGETHSALAASREALGIQERLGDRDGQAATLYNIGLMLRAHGDFQAAAGALGKALDLNRRLSDRTSEAKTINALGLVHLDLGEEPGAADSFQKALELARLQRDRSTEADALTNQALLDSRNGRLAIALEKHGSALAIRRDLGDRAGEAESLNNAGSIQEARGAMLDALDRYDTALAIQREIGGARGEALALTNRGRLRCKIGSVREGLIDLEEAVRILRRLGDSRNEAAALEILGRAKTEAGDYGGASRDLEESLRIRRAASDRRAEASGLDALGLLALRKGDVETSLDLLDRAIRLAVAAGDRVTRASALTHLANARLTRGEIVDALRLHKEAQGLWRAQGDRAAEAACWNNLAAIYATIGERQTALSHLGESLQISLGSSDRAGEALARNNLGVLQEEAGNWRTAAEEYRHAVRIREEIGDRRGAAFSRQNLASALRHQGSLAEARREAERSLGEFRGIGNRSGEVLALLSLGEVIRDAKKAEEAADRFTEALRLAEALGLREEAYRAEDGLAACREAQGRWREALDRTRGALGRLEPLRKELISEEFQASFLAGRLDTYERGIRILWSHSGEFGKGASASALELVERARGRALLELLGESRADLRRKLDPRLLRREAELLSRISRLGGELRTAGETRSAEALRRDLGRAEEGLELLQVEMRRSAPQYADLAYPLPPTVSEIRSRLLAPDDVLLEYFLGTEASYGWAVSREFLTWWRMPPAGEIEAAVRRLGESLHSEGGDLGPDPAFLSGSRDLARILLPPGGLPKEARIQVVPDGILHHLPFETLAGGGSLPDSRLLLEEHEISYLPSAGFLRLLRSSPANPGSREAPRRILAFGDAPPSAADSAGPSESLPFAREEIQRIAARFLPARRSVRLGEEASEEALKSLDLRSYGFLHFATHGWIDEEFPARSGLILASRDDGPEDGVLRRSEILTMQLGSSLVVLSSCRSGFGRQVRGEGILGLARAFFYAGARATVVSLWNVKDRSTTELMEAFYGSILRGEPAGSALRSAKLALLRSPRPELSHPSRWAPFILIGDRSFGVREEAAVRGAGDPSK
jgi:tetratricopeptide (TPR) repeat protein